MNTRKQPFQQAGHLLLFVIDYSPMQKSPFLETLYQLFIAELQTVPMELRKLRPKQGVILQFGKRDHIETHPVRRTIFAILNGNDTQTPDFLLYQREKPFRKRFVYKIRLNQLFHDLQRILKFQLIIQEITFGCHKFLILHDTPRALRCSIVVQLISCTAKRHTYPFIHVTGIFQLHAFPSPHLFPDLSTAVNNIFRCCHLFQPHRTAGMQLLCADADFRAEAKLPAIRETCRRIHIYCRRIHFI